MKKVEILFSMMKDGSPVTLDAMLDKLDVKQGSIMCLISALRNDFGAEIETQRDGRKVLSYQLMNAEKVKIPTKGAAKVAKPVKAKPAKVVAAAKTVVARKAKVAKTETDEIPTLDVQEINDEAELASLKAELGLSESYSE